jgi:hypothetical protein
VQGHSVIWLHVRDIVYVHSNLRLADKLQAVAYNEDNVSWCCTTPEDLGESAPRRDGAQDETRRFANPAIASYLFIVLEHAYQYLIYVCSHSFASVRDIRTHR